LNDGEVFNKFKRYNSGQVQPFGEKSIRASIQEYSKKKDMKPTIKFLIKQYKKTLNKVPTKKDKK